MYAGGLGQLYESPICNTNHATHSKLDGGLISSYTLIALFGVLYILSVNYDNFCQYKLHCLVYIRHALQ